MKYAELNKRFTEVVAGYMAKGYVINTATMDGSQGEIAKVDLTDGREILRVRLKSLGYESAKLKDGHYFYGEGVVLTVGRADSKVVPNSHNTWQTLWDNECEVIFEEKWYRAGRDNSWLVTREEAIENCRKSCERYERNNTYEDRFGYKELGEKASRIVLDFVKRQPRCKTAKLADVKVRKYNGKKFVVEYKNHRWELA